MARAWPARAWPRTGLEGGRRRFFHEFSGWIVFLFAFVMILVIQKFIVKVAPKPAQALSPSASAAAV